MSNRFAGTARALLAVFVTGMMPTSDLRSQTAPVFTVTPSTSATTLAQNIVGAGVTLVGTPRLTGAAVQSGVFDNFTTGPFTNPVTRATGTVSIPRGVILSSGRVQDATGTFVGGADSETGSPGDADLSRISGFSTNDAVSLEFSFIPDSNEIFIGYLFASTEYPHFVNSSFNDVFAFFVNGVNVAVVPGTTDPVTINKINAGNPEGTAVTNAQYFTQYSTTTTPFNYGGATVLLTARATVNRGVVNTFRFAIADSSDTALDSAVLIGTGSFSTAPPPGSRLTIPTVVLPNGQVQVPYSHALAATGGVPPYSWRLAAGPLPPGLTLTAAGVIQGVPTAAGTYPIVVQVMDAQENSATSQPLSLRILPAGPVITTEALPGGVALTQYTFQLQASGGAPPLRWALASGSLPPGFSISPNGVISGTSGVPLSQTFAVRVSDASGLSDTKSFVLSIGAPEPVRRSLEIATVSLQDAQVGRLYAATFLARNGSEPLTWGFSGLPAGIQSNSAGEIIGTPIRPGTFSIRAEVVDDSGARATGTFSLVVRPATVVITTERVPDGRVGVAYLTNLVAAGGIPPYSFSVASGTLPTGVSLNTNGVLSGTPTQPGRFEFIVQASDASGAMGTRSFTSVIRPPVLVITTPTLPGATVGTPYTSTLAAAGGTPPYTWSITGLPEGLSLNATTGVISGTAVRSGSFPVAVRVTDRENDSAARDYTLQVTTEVVITSVLGSLISGTPVSVQLTATGGRVPLAWSVTGGSLPTGLTLNAQGLLSGTPTATGDFNFTVQARDADNVAGSKAFAVRVIAPLTITTEAAPAARFGTAYSLGLAATGGTPPYTWSIARGELPPGLTLSSSGAISGSPTAAGVFSFSVQAADAGTPQQTAQRALSIQVQLPDVPGLSISVPANPQAGQQLRVGVAIPAAYPVEVTGTLTLTFAPNAANNADDPAIQFSTGGRSISFTIPAGQTQAVFRVPDLGVQTGTTAGTITLTTSLQAGGGPVNCNCPLTQTIVVPRTAPVITAVRVTRSAGGFNVLITGFSTTREVTQGVFRFAGASSLQTTELTVPLTAAFNTYYQGSAAAQFGGQFSLTLPFTIQGDTSTVTSVTVTLTNGAGTSPAVSASF